MQEHICFKKHILANVSDTNQHEAILDVEVEEEKEGDEEAEKGNSGALPQTPHFVQGFPHQPHVVLCGICRRSTRGTLSVPKKQLRVKRHPIVEGFVIGPCGHVT